MKRGADEQLTKDDNDLYDEIEHKEDEPRKGMQVADASVLAGRKIRGLPKRLAGSGASSVTASTSATEPPAVPKFSGFAGFGSSSSTLNPITSFASSSNTFNFSTTAATSTPLTDNPAKAAPAPPKTVSPASTEEVDPKALKYYKSLRGLNNSVLSSLTNAVDADPFVDITPILEQYRTIRETIQKEFDGESTTKSATQPPASSAPTFSVPTPPSNFLFAGKKVSTPTAPQDTSFTTSSFPTTFAPFKPTFGSEKSNNSMTTKESTTTSSPFTFGSSAATSESKVKDITPSPFAFGSSSSGGFVSNPFSFGKKSDDIEKTLASDSAKPSSFSFGFAKITTSDAASADPDSTSAADNTSKKSSSFTFGSSTSAAPSKDAPMTSLPFSFGSKPATGSSGTSTTSTSTPLFGTSAPGTPSKPDSPSKAISTFGAGTGGKSSPGSGSLGNPVGFGFAVGASGDSGTSSTDAATAGDKGKSSIGGFTFGGSSSFTFGGGSSFGSGSSGTAGGGLFGTVSTAPKAAEEDTNSAADNATDDSASIPGLQAAEGAGEEDEELTHEVRVAVFKFDKKKSTWSNLRTGDLRLKHNTVNGSRRALLRNEAQKIIINFNLYPAMDPSIEGRTVAFTGHDGSGDMSTYKVRTKTEVQAQDLLSALQREIQFVKESQS